ncbi:hypothetical protein [Pantoea ananatis]|uniref:hypothetical protein n=1 Tax=Pantoea ananas TaxID=553 RepID=UPI000FEC81CF|nr:hypothetical protein [Pantoea ananatis]QAB32607.1 hypothetical protein EPK90_22900 [Pantoea ananatis]
MKMRLLTALVVTGCFSQMAMASRVTTGTIENKTTTTATVTLNQPITLVNTLTPVEGLKGGTELPTLDSGLIANGNLNIQEAGVTAQLALNTAAPGNESFITYATGHTNDAAYKLEYRVYTTSDDTDYIIDSDGEYTFSKKDVNNFGYTVNAVSSQLPKAGSYVISVKGAIYNP